MFFIINLKYSHMKLKNLPKNGMMRIATLFVFALILTFSTTLTAQDASLLMHLPFDGTIEDMKPGDSKVAITNISTGQTTNFNNTIAKKGECIDFDADGHYPVLQTPADFLNPYPETNRNGFSISLWYYAHSLAGHQMMNQLGNNGKNTITVGGDEQLHSYLGGVTGPLMTMEAGKWYHIAFTYDGINLKFFFGEGLIC